MFRSDHLKKVVITGYHPSTQRVKAVLGKGIFFQDRYLELGESMIQSYRKAGNPTKDFYHRSLHYSNYLDQGFDLVFADSRLVKIILHTN